MFITQIPEHLVYTIQLKQERQNNWETCCMIDQMDLSHLHLLFSRSNRDHIMHRPFHPQLLSAPMHLPSGQRSHTNQHWQLLSTILSKRIEQMDLSIPASFLDPQELPRCPTILLLYATDESFDTIHLTLLS